MGHYDLSEAIWDIIFANEVLNGQFGVEKLASRIKYRGRQKPSPTSRMWLIKFLMIYNTASLAADQKENIPRKIGKVIVVWLLGARIFIRSN